MANSVTLERLQSMFLRELALIINKDRKINNQPYYNIIDVRITRDYSFATVYYSILSDEPEDLKNAQEILDKIKSKVKHELSQKMKNLRKMPDLKFKFDEALAYGNKIDSILKEINKKAD